MCTSQLIGLPDGVGEEPESRAHVRVPGHQMISSWKNISSKINQFWRSTCSSTCQTCPVPRPRCWMMCPRPFASCSELISMRSRAPASTSDSINWNFYLHFRETAAHLAKLTFLFSSVLISVASISVDCPQLFPLTFHKDFSKSAIPYFFSVLHSQSAMLVTILTIVKCQSEPTFLNVLIFVDNSAWLWIRGN